MSATIIIGHSQYTPQPKGPDPAARITSDGRGALWIHIAVPYDGTTSTHDRGVQVAGLTLDLVRERGGPPMARAVLPDLATAIAAVQDEPDVAALALSMPWRDLFGQGHPTGPVWLYVACRRRTGRPLQVCADLEAIAPMDQPATTDAGRLVQAHGIDRFAEVGRRFRAFHDAITSAPPRVQLAFPPRLDAARAACRATMLRDDPAICDNALAWASRWVTELGDGIARRRTELVAGRDEAGVWERDRIDRQLARLDGLTRMLAGDDPGLRRLSATNSPEETLQPLGLLSDRAAAVQAPPEPGPRPSSRIRGGVV